MLCCYFVFFFILSGLTTLFLTAPPFSFNFFFFFLAAFGYFQTTLAFCQTGKVSFRKQAIKKYLSIFFIDRIDRVYIVTICTIPRFSGSQMGLVVFAFLDRRKYATTRVFPDSRNLNYWANYLYNCMTVLILEMPLRSVIFLTHFLLIFYSYYYLYYGCCLFDAEEAITNLITFVNRFSWSRD